MSETIQAPEQRTIDVDVQNLDTAAGRCTVMPPSTTRCQRISAAIGRRSRRVRSPASSTRDVRGLLNYDANEVFGRTKSGTLRLFDEPKGLSFELDLPDSPLGENVSAVVQRGDIDGASFRFDVGHDSWDNDVRTIEKVSALYDAYDR
jgi:hypothetical protein